MQDYLQQGRLRLIKLLLALEAEKLLRFNLGGSAKCEKMPRGHQTANRAAFSRDAQNKTAKYLLGSPVCSRKNQSIGGRKVPSTFVKFVQTMRRGERSCVLVPLIDVSKLV